MYHMHAIRMLLPFNVYLKKREGNLYSPILFQCELSNAPEADRK